MARPKRNQKSNTTTSNNNNDFDKNGRLKQKGNIVKRVNATTAAKATANKLGVKSAIAANNGNTTTTKRTKTSTSTTTNTTLEQQEIDTGMQTRSSNRSTSNQNTNKSLNIESKEPRKRRMASLNAEALLHIYSTPANGNGSNTQATTAIVENTNNASANDTKPADDNNEVNSKRKNGTNKADDEDEEEEKAEVHEKKENGDSAVKNTKKEEAGEEEDGDDEEEEDDDEEDEEEEEEEEQEDVKAKKAKTTTKKKPTKAQAAKTAKQKATAAANKKQRAEDLLKQQQQQQMDAPRPKREASMRASAMIIQTNEIEKTRYNYSSFLNSHHHAAENNNKNNSSNNNNHENENNTANNRHNSSSNNNNKKAKATSKTKKNNKKSTAHDDDDDEEEDEDDDEIYHNNNNNNSKNKVESKSQPQSTAIKVKVVELTQENLAEHNRVFAQASAASSGANCSQFSSNTRDYIQKWTNDNSINLDEKPFPVGTIPLETFGAKILNAPQYLLHKSKATGSSSVVSASNSTTTTTPATPAAATPQQQQGNNALHEVPSSVNVLPPTSVVNSSHHNHHHNHHHHHHHNHTTNNHHNHKQQQIKQESDVVAVNTPSPTTTTNNNAQKTNNANLNNYSSHQNSPIINSKTTNTPSPRQNGQNNSNTTAAASNAQSPLAANVLAQQQIANLQLATQIEQAQLQAQLQQQQNAAVQNTALNNLAAALNLTMQPQMTPTSPTAVAQAAALFQQNAAFVRPYLPIFSFASPWQYSAAAAALQPLPDRCIIQPAPVHVFQQPTVNVVVKPQTSVPIYGHSHKSSHKSQKIEHDELKITLNHSNPSKQGNMMSASFHKSTSAPTIGVTSNSASYQVKIKTEKLHSKASNNYVDPLSASAANTLPYLAGMPESLLDPQQLQQFQQHLHSNNFMLPNFPNNQAALNFAKVFQNPNLAKPLPQTTKKSQHYPSSPAKAPKKAKEEVVLKKAQTVVAEPVSTTAATVVEEAKDKDVEIIDEIKPAVKPVIKEKDELMVVDKPLTAEEIHPINDTEITTTTAIINENDSKDDCLSSCSSSTSSNVLHIDLDSNTNQAQPEEQQLRAEQPIIVTTQNEELSVSSSATQSASTTTNTNLAVCTNETTIQTATDDLTKVRQKFVSSSSTITNFYNDEDINDTENSISSFALSLKANKRLAIPQLWRTCGESFTKLIAINPNHKPVYRQCYKSIMHEKVNETIKVFDCVLLRSSESLSTGTPTTPTTLGRQISTSSNLLTNGCDSASITPVCDLATPTSTLRQSVSNSDVFIAKVSSFWRDEITNKIMMELLWYYHPQQTDLKYKAKFDKQELFASKHYDVLDVDCIEDKCYVLTLNEYNRWKTQEKYTSSFNSSLSQQQNLVPKLNEYPRAERQPLSSTASENVFFCRHIYDFRTKRLVKYTQ